MERANRLKIIVFSLAIALVVLLAAAAALFVAEPVACAQNSNVKVTINDRSVFGAYGDAFAFVTDGTLYLAYDDALAEIAVDASRVDDLVMNDDTIVLLARGDGTGALLFYEYSVSHGAQPVLRKSDYALENAANIDNIGVSDNGALYYQRKDEVVRLDFDGGALTPVTVYSAKYDLFVFDAFAIGGNALYALQNGNLYRIDETTVIRDEPRSASEPLPERFLRTDAEDDLTALSVGANRAIVSDARQRVFYVSLDGGTDGTYDARLSDGTVKTVAAQSGGRLLLYAFTPSYGSIKLYEIQSDALRYVNTFDGTRYTDPDKFDVLRAAVLSRDLSVYISPKNLQIAFSLAQGDAVLLLTQCAYMGDYYYLTDGKGNFGYLPIATTQGDDPALVMLDARQDTPLGVNAQPLHDETPLYAYPFDLLSPTQKAQPIALLSYQQRLTVIDDVAAADGKQMWKWYRVAMIDRNTGEIATGFVKTENLSVYTEMYDASARKAAKINAHKFGKVVKAYALPDENSRVLREMVDGEDVTLAEPYDKNAEWTAIVYGDNDVAYIRTEAVQIGGLTPVQITVIVICSLVAAATVACGVIIGVKRRRRLR